MSKLPERLRIAEIFEKDPERQEKYDRIGHRLLKYVDLLEDYPEEIDESLKPKVQALQKAYESLPGHFKCDSTSTDNKPNDVRTYLMESYPRAEGGNEINTVFKTEMLIFETIENINKSLALIGAYPIISVDGDDNNPIYNTIPIVTKLQMDCQDEYKRYCSCLGDLSGKNTAIKLKIIEFLMFILEHIYKALVLFDSKTTETECPLVVVLMSKILMDANHLKILNTQILKEKYDQLCAAVNSACEESTHVY